MPEMLVIAHSAVGVPMCGRANFLESLGLAGFVEFRRYELERKENLVHMHKILARHGIHPLLTGTEGAFLFGFATLARREKVWRELSAAPEWPQLGVQLGELAIYKVDPHPAG
jgi:hypothetical protein